MLASRLLRLSPGLAAGRAFRFAAAAALGLVAALTLAACGRAPASASAPTPAAATPDPREEALIERTVRARLAEENRITEQQLVNARAAASQRMIGRQMFLKLEAQYRERQTELSGQADSNPEQPPILLAQTQAQPSASPASSATPQPPAPAATSAAPDPKREHPPVEDQADSMKPDAHEKAQPTPTPSPTAPAAPQNRSSADKSASPTPKPTAAPK